MAKKYQKNNSTKITGLESFPQMDFSDLKARMESVILQKYGTQVHAAEKLNMKQNTISSNITEGKTSTQKISGELLVKLKLNNPDLDLNQLVYGEPLDPSATVVDPGYQYGIIEASQRKLLAAMSEYVKRITIEQCDEMLSKHKELLHPKAAVKAALFEFQKVRIMKKTTPFKPAELVIPAETAKDQKWYILFHVYHAHKAKVVRKRFYKIPNVKPPSMRKALAEKICHHINLRLENGEYIGQPKYTPQYTPVENSLPEPEPELIFVSSAVQNINESKKRPPFTHPAEQ